MKTTITLPLLVIAIISGISAQAETYQWKDKNGRTVISDTPPLGSQKAMQVIGSAISTTGAAEKSAEAPKTTAEKDLEFKKRQLEAKEKASKEAKEQAAAAEKKDNCERAKRNLAALESSQPLSTLDENGKPKAMDNTAREQEMARARQVIADACK